MEKTCVTPESSGDYPEPWRTMSRMLRLELRANDQILACRHKSGQNLLRRFILKIHYMKIYKYRYLIMIIPGIFSGLLIVDKH